MKTKILGALTAFLAGTSMALGQASLSLPQEPATRSPSPAPAAPAVGAPTLPDAAPAKSPPAASVVTYGSSNVTWDGGPHHIDGAHGGCPDGGSCGPSYRVYGGVEYLLWWIRDAQLPELVGVIPATLANVTELPPGAINPVFGGSVGTNGHSGARVTVGYFIDAEERVGLEASGFDLDNGRHNAFLSSQGMPVLGPLFFDAVLQRQVILEESVPNERAAALAIGLNDRLWSAEANVRLKTVTVFSDATSLLFGFRTLQFDEGLSIASASVANSPDQFTLTTFDSFGTHNQFYGPQIGINSDFHWGSAYFNFVGKLALGDMHETANIQGVSQTFSSGILQSTTPGGVLALPTNIGHHSRDRFAAIPEVNVNLGYEFGQHLRVFIGYDFLYVNNVLRPGDQINPVDGRQVPVLDRFDPTAKVTQPVFSFREAETWAQGLNVGLEIRY